MKRKIDLRIKEVLAEKNLTMKELAHRMGVSPQYVSSIVNGSGASLNSLLAVADALGVPFSSLIVNKSICPHCGKEIHLSIR